MNIDVLDATCYLAPLNIVEEGISDVHIARVRTRDGTPITAYVKTYSRVYQLLNEVTGYLLADALHYRVPDYAAIIHVPIRRMPRPNPEWISTNPEGVVPAWCTSQLFSDSLKLHFNKHIPSIIAELRGSNETPDILAFDDWVANVDRNVGNLVRLAKGQYALIDHGQIIGNKCWEVSAIDPSRQYENKLRDLLDAHANSLPMKNAVLQSSRRHEYALNEISVELWSWWSNLGEDAAQRLYNFLEYRGEERFVKSQLRLIA